MSQREGKAPECIIHTHAGRGFDLFDFCRFSIRLESIARALAMKCRFNGMVKFHYSVALHSLFVEQIVRERYGLEYALQALFHDCTEFPLPDVVSPFKPCLYVRKGKDFEPYREYEDKLARHVFLEFGIDPIMPPVIKVVDLEVLAAERAQVVHNPKLMHWRELPEPADIEIKRMQPEEVETMFIERFCWLQKAIAEAKRSRPAGAKERQHRLTT